ncbi:hypothetical protein [Methanoregula sp.]|uniref:hypothetical protein n=1 Tax=Methanoregula sp. TaxID=2052170 RepID=UPI003569A44F
MTYSAILTPFAIILELVVFILGVYAGYCRKKPYAYLFAVTFLIFAAFDYLGSIGVSTDIIAILNIVAVLAALAGMYLVVREKSA